jgi:hypothetical protein
MSPFAQAPEGFTPEILELLDCAFTAAWCELQWRKSSATSREKEQATRKAIVRSIIDLAATGVRESERLKRYALHGAEQARPRTRTIVHLPD